MKQVVTNYSFSTSAKTITLSDFGASHPVDLKRLYLITDTTTNKILYNFADSTVTTASIGSNNVITLGALQGGESNGDSLMIVYEAVVGDPLYDIPLSEIYDSVSSDTANVVAADSGLNGLATASATKTYTFTTSASGAQTILANTQCEGYNWIEIVYSSVGSGLAVGLQFAAASGGNYIASQSVYTQASGQSTLGATNNTLYYGPIHGNFFQLAVSALTSGTFAGTVTLRSVAQNTDATKALQSGTWTVAVSNNALNTSTGVTVPSGAVYMGMDSGGNLVGLMAQGQAGDGGTGGVPLATGLNIYNGSTYDRIREATAAAGTTGTGLLGVGNLGYDGTNWQYAGIDASHNLKVNVNAALPAGTNGIGNVGTVSAVVNVGQKTVSTSATQVSASSTVPTNGIVVRALSTNAASIFVGGSGVTTSTGYELVAGESVSFTCNLNTLYIISVASTTDKICWNVE